MSRIVEVNPIVEALVHRRRALGLTQTEVGMRAGMAQNAVSRFERGAAPNLATVERYAAAVQAEIVVVAW